MHHWAFIEHTLLFLNIPHTHTRSTAYLVGFILFLKVYYLIICRLCWWFYLGKHWHKQVNTPNKANGQFLISFTSLSYLNVIDKFICLVFRYIKAFIQSLHKTTAIPFGKGRNRSKKTQAHYDYAAKLSKNTVSKWCLNQVFYCT